jgi:hypothetical protein
MRRTPLLLLVALVATLPGCARDSTKWPSLAPRPGEIAPLVPRTPLGACAGCGADITAAAAAAEEPPPPAPLPVPADVTPRLDAVAKALATIAADYPAQLAITEKAVAAGKAGGDAEIEAELQRSRLEAVFLSLSAQSQTLDGISDDLIGKAGAEPYAARVSTLRAEIARLAAVRDAAGL